MLYKHKNGSDLFLVNFENNTLLYNKANGEIALLKNCDGKILFDDNSLLVQELEKKGFFKAVHSLEKAKTLINRKIKFEQLYLITSEGCNLRCKYCRQHTSSSYRNLTNAEIRQAVTDFFSYSDTLNSVVFYGGEPLLNKEGVKYALQYISAINPDVKFSMITNAILCDDDTAKMLADYHVDVIVSADGCQEYHDTARVYETGGPSYEDTIKGYWKLKNAGCVVGISCTIGPHNEKHFNELVNWMIELHPNSAWFGLPHGSQDNYAMGLEDADCTHKNLLASFPVLREDGVSLLQVEKKIRDLLMNNIIAYDCKACKNRLVACPGGRYGVCEGAVTDQTMFFEKIEDAISISRKFQDTTPLVVETCRECIAQRICGGGCPYDKILRYQKTSVSDPYHCTFVRKLVTYSLQYIGSVLAKEDAEVIVADEELRTIILENLTLSKSNFIPLQFNADNNVKG